MKIKRWFCNVRDEARTDIFEYLEIFCGRRQRQRLTPLVLRLINQQYECANRPLLREKF